MLMRATARQLFVLALCIALNVLTAELADAQDARPIAAPAPQSQLDRFVGLWEGAIQPGAIRLRLGLTIERDSLGGLRGFMTSIDQGSQRVAATITVRGDTLVVDMSQVQTVYRAVITAGRDTLRGTFHSGAPLPLDLHRTASLGTPPARPQEPRPPFPYGTREVVFESAPGVRLAGTLVLPAGAGPHPAVVFVTGSGPQDRDETLMGHKPFLLLADQLARKGIASLRFDDRGYGRSSGTFASATSADFADDAEAAVRFLRSESAVARDRVGILGHSEGGMVGPMVAARSRDVAFLVLVAAPGIPGDSLLMIQQRLILTASDVPPANIATAAALNRVIFSAIKAGGDSAAIITRLRASLGEVIAAFPPEVRQQATPDALVREASQAVTPWFRFLLTHGPRVALRQVRVPVLALNGALDLQVPPRENLPAIEVALREAGNRDYRMVELPGLNHLLQTAQTGLPTEYQVIEETMSPLALEMIVTWIAERFVRR